MRAGLCCAALIAAMLSTPFVFVHPAFAQETGAAAIEPSADKQARIKAYSRTRQILAFVRVVWTMAALALVLYSGLSTQLRSLAETAFAHPLAARALYFVLCLLALAVLHLPLSLYSSYAIEHRYGLSAQSLPAWLWEECLGLLVMLAIGVPILCFVYWLFGRSPQHWWLWFSLASLPLGMLLVVVAPVVIDPLFNRYTPLRDAELKARILEMAHEQGIDARHVFEVDKSKQTRKLNALVTGLLGTKRVVLWDTLLEAMPQREIEAVMAHEMGHYVKRHVWWGLLTGVAAVSLAALLGSRLGPALIDRLPDRLAVGDIGDPAGFPMLALLVVVIAFLLAPATNAVSRHIERAADLHALQVTADPAAAIASFRTLSEANLSDPEPPPFVEFWLYSHPSLAQRIASAESYARENHIPLAP